MKLENYLYALAGMLVGIAIMATIYVLSVQSKTEISDKTDAATTECINILTESQELTTICLAALDRTDNVTQSLIDTVNECVNLLWTMPLEELEAVRKGKQPDPLPSIKPIKEPIEATYL